MIIYRYLFCFREYEERFNATAQHVLQRALDDIDECRYCPLSIRNRQGIEIYSQTAIFRAYIQPFLCEHRAIQQRLAQGALLPVSAPNIGR